MEAVFAASQLFKFSTVDLGLITLVFIWSGFVRSGLGFGGAALSLPLLLMIFDSPLYWLPIIGTQLLIFSFLTLRTRMANVDWAVLKKTSAYILPAKIVGVLGLVSLPSQWLVLLIYTITLAYGILWMFNLKIKSGSGWVSNLFLIIGGYFSGTSLTGAPPIVAVYTQLVKPTQVRDTLFGLWFILVTIKLATLAMFGVDLQYVSTLMLTPIAFVGHVIGMKMHHSLAHNDELFRRVTGGALIAICVLGLRSII
ncbi:MAG: putative membrane protein YfcA [Gammaproteobacteria bacterium]|jgi:uncharacterized membrane protein YfcA